MSEPARIADHESKALLDSVVEVLLEHETLDRRAVAKAIVRELREHRRWLSRERGEPQRYEASSKDDDLVNDDHAPDDKRLSLRTSKLAEEIEAQHELIRQLIRDLSPEPDSDVQHRADDRVAESASDPTLDHPSSALAVHPPTSPSRGRTMQNTILGIAAGVIAVLLTMSGWFASTLYDNIDTQLAYAEATAKDQQRQLSGLQEEVRVGFAKVEGRLVSLGDKLGETNDLLRQLVKQRSEP